MGGNKNGKLIKNQSSALEDGEVCRGWGVSIRQILTGTVSFGPGTCPVACRRRSSPRQEGKGPLKSTQSVRSAETLGFVVMSTLSASDKQAFFGGWGLLFYLFLGLYLLSLRLGRRYMASQKQAPFALEDICIEWCRAKRNRWKGKIHLFLPCHTRMPGLRATCII